MLNRVKLEENVTCVMQIEVHPQTRSLSPAMPRDGAASPSTSSITDGDLCCHQESFWFSFFFLKEFIMINILSVNSETINRDLTFTLRSC